MENTETIIANSPHSLKLFPVEQNPIRIRLYLGLLLILLSLPSFVRAQSADYPAIFGNDWERAQQFVSENSIWMAEKLERYNIDFYEAVAVIFPELVRYSALRDRMEITMLKALYVNVGKEYANFSIGHFQMKPSFAEEIAGSLSYTGSGRLRRLIQTPDDFEDERDYRVNVVADLEDVQTQLDYLIVFLKICEHKYKTRQMGDQERIRFLATAYNYGLKSSGHEIENATGRRFFSTSMIKKDTYSYSDISLYWYNNHCLRLNSIR